MAEDPETYLREPFLAVPRRRSGEHLKGAHREDEQQDYIHAPLAPFRYRQANSRTHRGATSRSVLFAGGFVLIIVTACFILWRSLKDYRAAHALLNPIDTGLYPPSGPTAEDGTVDTCISGWNQNGGSFSASLDLPLSPTKHFWYSRGTRSSGNILVTQGRTSNKDMIEVDVSVNNLPNADLLTHINVCSLQHGFTDRGIAIFTPHSWDANDTTEFNFDVIVRLPARSGETLKLPTFSTNLPHFAHRFTDLTDSVEFNNMHLAAPNAPIRCRGVTAVSAEILASNSPISGNFTINGGWLSLYTTNGAIDTSITLHQDNDASAFPRLDIRTSNGPISSTVELTASPKVTQPQYGISVHTANRGLALSVSSAPPHAEMHLSATTSNAPASVALPRTYEGKYSIEAFNVAGKGGGLQCDENAEDPEGQGRERSVRSWDSGPGAVWGTIKWGDEELEGNGEARVHTSNAPATLNLL